MTLHLFRISFRFIVMLHLPKHSLGCGALSMRSSFGSMNNGLPKQMFLRSHCSWILFSSICPVASFLGAEVHTAAIQTSNVQTIF